MEYSWILPFNTKKFDSIKYSGILKAYLTSKGFTDPKIHSSLEEMESMREKLRNTTEKTQSTLALYYQYFKLFSSISCRIPFSESDTKILFNWNDIYEERVFCSYLANFEVSNVIFNIMALYTNMGSNVKRTDEDSIRSACKCFQSADGVLDYLKKYLESEPLDLCVYDLDADSLQYLSLILKSSIQICYYDLGCLKKMKSNQLSQLANQVSIYIELAQKHFGLSPVLGNVSLPQRFESYLKLTHSLYKALAYLQSSFDYAAMKEFGNSISRLESAECVLSVAKKHRYDRNLPYLSAYFAGVCDLVSSRLRVLRHENDTIYYEYICPEAKLRPLESRPVGGNNPISMEKEFAYECLESPFSQIVPTQVQEVDSVYCKRKMELLEDVISEENLKTSLFRASLAEMGFPGLVEDYNGVDCKLESLKLKIECIQRGDRNCDLRVDFEKLDRMAEKVLHVINVAESHLDVGGDDEEPLGVKYDSRLDLLSSGNEMGLELRKEVKKSQSYFEQARKVDNFLKSKYLALLGRMRDLSDFESLLSPPEVDFESLQSLKDMAVYITAFLQNREKLVEEFKRSIKEDDLIPVLTKIPIQRDYTPVLEAQLKKFFPLKEKIRKSMAKQDALLGRLCEMCERFLKDPGTSSASKRRMERVRDLEEAYDAYMVVKNNLVQGLKFYAGFQLSVEKLERDCEYFAMKKGLRKMGLKDAVKMSVNVDDDDSVVLNGQCGELPRYLNLRYPLMDAVVPTASTTFWGRDAEDLSEGGFYPLRVAPYDCEGGDHGDEPPLYSDCAKGANGG